MVSLTNGVLTFLLLLFAFHLEKGDCKYFNFNCQFDDRDYNLKSEYDLERVQFGEEPEGVVGNIQTIFNRIRKIYALFMAGGLTYNGVDNYIRFYKYYKTVRDKFKKEQYQVILRNYNVTIDSDEETAGNIITLMNIIASQVPSLAAASFLVTASPNYKDMLKKKLKSPEDYTYWSYVNVGGVIKINDKSSGRVGYILLDPRRFEHLQVVMEDGGKAPFNFFGSVRSYFKIARARLLWFEPFNTNDHNRTASSFIYGNGIAYYFKRPFCSFVEHTVKYHLVNLKRALTKGVKEDPRCTAFVVESYTSLPAVNFYAFFYVSNVDNETSLMPTEEGSRKEPKESKDLSARINCLCTYLGTKQNLDSCKDKMLSRIRDFKEISSDKRFITDSSTWEKYLEENSDPPEDGPTRRLLPVFVPWL